MPREDMRGSGRATMGDVLVPQGQVHAPSPVLRCKEGVNAKRSPLNRGEGHTSPVIPEVVLKGQGVHLDASSKYVVVKEGEGELARGVSDIGASHREVVGLAGTETFQKTMRTSASTRPENPPWGTWKDGK